MKLLFILLGVGAGAGSPLSSPPLPPSEPPFQCLDLTLKAKGWQMISFHCAGTYIEYRVLDDIMDGVPFETDDKILSRDPHVGLVFATYTGTKWVGNLVKRGLSYDKGYKVLFSGPVDSVIKQIGWPWSGAHIWVDSVNAWVDPALVVLSEGWNWIGHRIDVSYNINSNITVEHGTFSIDDQFKTRSLSTLATANYDGSKFQGSLTQLEPGFGYMVRVSKSVTFKYNLLSRPSSPSPPRPAPQPPGCPNTCLGAGPEYANDGECDDGGPGSAYSVCAFGTDCNDCKNVMEEVGGKTVNRIHPGCTGPHADLIVNSDLLKTSLYIKNIDAPEDACFVEEGCLGGTGQRKVLAFSTQVHNIGCAPFLVGVPNGSTPGCFDDGNPIRDRFDEFIALNPEGCPPFSPPTPTPPPSPPPFNQQRRLRSDGGDNQRERPGSDARLMSNTSQYGHYSGGKAGSSGGSTAGRYPSRRRLDNGGWSWHDCHQHWHYDNYAHYALRKLCTNEDVAWEDRPVVGHKNGWCVSDVDTYGPTGGGGRCNHPSPYLPLGLHEFTCMNMGISSGCSDLYKSDYACQWIDITDITDGYYWLTVSW